MSETRLNITADPQPPACSACGADTAPDVDGTQCDDCGIRWTWGDLRSADYIDEDDQPCGKPCDNYWHADHKIERGMGFDCTPCVLPDTHTSGCHTQCEPRVADHD